MRWQRPPATPFWLHLGGAVLLLVLGGWVAMNLHTPTPLEPRGSAVPAAAATSSSDDAAATAMRVPPLPTHTAHHLARAAAAAAAAHAQHYAPFTEGECCPGAVIVSKASRDSVCRFRRSRDVLVHRPAPPPPEKFGTTCLALAHDLLPGQAPEYGVLLHVWNSGHRLRLVLTQLLKLTRGPWELIVLFDGSEDDSYAVATALLQRWLSGAWPRCPYGPEWVGEGRIWEPAVNWTGSQGDIGRECWVHPRSEAGLVGVRFLKATRVGLHLTAGDNIKMLASRARYYALVDDDQLATVHGWNVKAAYPLRTWPDTISASMRCGHGFPDPRTGHSYGAVRGAKCRTTQHRHPALPARCFFSVTDTANRGPLLLRAAYVAALGFLDELHFMGVATGGLDDHDLNYRAWHQAGWVAGHIPVDYTEERSRRPGAQRGGGGIGNATRSLSRELEEWFWARRAASPHLNNTWAPCVVPERCPHYGASNRSAWKAATSSHNAFRLIADEEFHSGCGMLQVVPPGQGAGANSGGDALPLPLPRPGSGAGAQAKPGAQLQAAAAAPAAPAAAAAEAGLPPAT